VPTAIDGLVRPHFDALIDVAGDPPLYDAHTHIGANDPDGMKQTVEELLDGFPDPSTRAVVFPMHEPDGYRVANDAVLEAAAASDGRLVCFCRVDPHRDSLAEARRCLDAGALGIKLHPRAEGFTLAEPAIVELASLAHERRATVLIHAGRGIPALGRDTVRLSGDFPDARFILAHAAISDLAWLWRELPAHRNLFVDTSWWHPSDLVALFSLVAPGQIVWASDSPYGDPRFSAVIALRCALQAGLTAEQVRAVMGGQLERVLSGGEPADLGPPPATRAGVHPLLERVVVHLGGALNRAFAHADPTEPLGLARLATAVGEDGPYAQVMSETLELLNAYESHLRPPRPGRVFPDALRLLIVALVLARTPSVPLPERPEAPAPVREEAE
jgi:predicted TIM-barrel fold metal-dependent hydrolase